MDVWRLRSTSGPSQQEVIRQSMREAEGSNVEPRNSCRMATHIIGVCESCIVCDLSYSMYDVSSLMSFGPIIIFWYNMVEDLVFYTILYQSHRSKQKTWTYFSMFHCLLFLLWNYSNADARPDFRRTWSPSQSATEQAHQLHGIARTPTAWIS